MYFLKAVLTMHIILHWKGNDLIFLKKHSFLIFLAPFPSAPMAIKLNSLGFASAFRLKNLKKFPL
jgi:hypothetical protein